MESKEFFKKFLSLYLWGNIAAMVLVVVLLCFGVKFGLDLYTHHGEGILVPNLVGKQFEDARRLLDAKGLVIEISDSGFSKKHPADCVLAQYPGTRDKVKQGHVIYVTVNSPHSPMLTIPDVIDNSSYREAEAKLTSMGFRLLKPQMVHGEKDWVYGITCRGRKLFAGDRVPVDKGLVLQIGDGTFDQGAVDVDYVEHVPDPEEHIDEYKEDDFEVVDPHEDVKTTDSDIKEQQKTEVDDSGINDF